ncbi:594_t:CDS:2 [Gigaspora rosea]|nr:594_t:CDS:2 [Gigaspora rosea]
MFACGKRLLQIRAIAELGYDHVTVYLECAYLRLKLESEAYLGIDDLYLICSDPPVGTCMGAILRNESMFLAPLSSQRCSHICLLEGLSLGGVGKVQWCPLGIWIHSDRIRLKKIGSLVLGNSGLSVKFRSEYCFEAELTKIFGVVRKALLLYEVGFWKKDYGVVLLVPAEWEAIPVLWDFSQLCSFCYGEELPKLLWKLLQSEEA